jgi:transcriptional regulator of NAD metabolism
MINKGDTVYVIFDIKSSSQKTRDILKGRVSEISKQEKSTSYHIRWQRLFTKENSYVLMVNHPIIPFNESYVYEDNSEGHKKVIKEAFEIYEN